MVAIARFSFGPRSPLGGEKEKEQWRSKVGKVSSKGKVEGKGHVTLYSLVRLAHDASL